MPYEILYNITFLKAVTFCIGNYKTLQKSYKILHKGSFKRPLISDIVNNLIYD